MKKRHNSIAKALELHLFGIKPSIDLFHNIFSPSGKQPEHRKLAHEL